MGVQIHPLQRCNFGVHNPRGISIGSTVFAGIMIVTDQQTDHASITVALQLHCNWPMSSVHVGSLAQLSLATQQDPVGLRGLMYRRPGSMCWRLRHVRSPRRGAVGQNTISSF